MEEIQNLAEQSNNYYTESAFEPEYASTGQRFANYIIDLIIFYIVMFGIGGMIGIGMVATGKTYQPWSEDAGSKLLEYLISFTIYMIFYTFSEGASGGRSIGKLITGTKAVKVDNTRITWTDALIRSLCRIVPFEPFSAFGGNPWHDRWSGTKVIRTR